MKPRPFTILLLSVATVSACQYRPVTDPGSSAYLPPPGSALELRQPVTIPAGSAHARLQNVQALGGGGEYYTSCRLWVNEVLPERQVIPPDTFRMSEVGRFQDCVNLVQAEGLRVAGLGTAVAASGDVTDCWYVWTMKLHSERHPEVRRLECRKLDDPALGTYPTFDRIRAALAPVAGFLAPDGSPYPPYR